VARLGVEAELAGWESALPLPELAVQESSGAGGKLLALRSSSLHCSLFAPVPFGSARMRESRCRLTCPAAMLPYDWFEERMEGQSLVDDSGTKYVPPHIGLFYCLGGIVLMGFVVQFVSGLLLTFYFTPTVIDACSSVHLLELWAHDGWFSRSLHRWASNFLLLAILLHSSRVSLAGGFRKPRELTWISGAFLAIFALAFGVSGYSLPWDQVGFWALQIVSAVPEILDDLLPGPGVGIVVRIRGGFSVGQETLSRTFTAHTLALPAGVSILSLCHFLLIRKQGVSGPL